MTIDELRRYAVSRSLFPPASLPKALEAFGFVQADPIRAPARAQDLTLRHRVTNYRAGDLERRAGGPPEGGHYVPQWSNEMTGAWHLHAGRQAPVGRGGALTLDVGYAAGQAPRERRFSQALADERARLCAFLRLVD